MPEVIAKSPVQITESALKQLRRIKEEQSLDDNHGLRIGVKGGGCSGFTYVLGFDVAKEKDEVFDPHVVVGRASRHKHYNSDNSSRSFFDILATTIS